LFSGVLFFNSQSLYGKLADLHDFIYSRPVVPIVVGVVETWFNISVPNVSLNLPAYNILRFDRPTHGGGVMLLVNNKLHIKLTKQMSFGPIQVLYADIECAFSVFNLIRFVCVYRPPNSDMVNSLCFLKALESEIAPLKGDKPTIIMGDFNLTHVDWRVPCTTLNHSIADEKLLLFSQRAFCTQVVTEPTHDANFTDLVFVSHNNLISNLKVDIPFSTSDHSSIEFEIALNMLGTEDSTNIVLPTARLDFSKTDHCGLAADLLNINWSSIFSINDSIDNAWDKFNNCIMSLIIKFTPLKSKSRCATQPVANKYLPLDIQRLINKKKLAWSLYKKSRRDSDKRTFRGLAKLVRVRIEAYRKEREECILKSASVKKFYAYVKDRMNPEMRLGPLRDSEGTLIINDSNKAEALNKFFHSVFTMDDNNMPSFDLRTAAVMDLPVFTPEEVRAALKESKNSNSCGPDGCPSMILKHYPELCIPLSTIFNMSMQQQLVPNAWKLANVIPIYKGKGSRLDVENYRPISLTNVFCKLMEKLISKKIINFLDTNNLLSPAQSGFRSSRSTLSQLLLAQAQLVDCINKRTCVDSVYTDMSKAFDSLSHKKLIVKLRAYGINSFVCQWIQAFLSNRRQRVVVNSGMSDWLQCTSGVPQGSVLGSLLFNIYINDLPDCVHHSNIYLYADDAKMFKSINCRLDCLLFQQDIDSISAWCTLWQLKLNILKCLYIRYGLVNRPTFDYSISGILLKKVMSTKDLGVVFDSKLSFSEQCNDVVNKGFMRANMLLKCFQSRDRRLQINLFNTFVRPILEFNSPVWSPHLIKDVTAIKRVQK
jgi:hypothetical protein